MQYIKATRELFFKAALDTMKRASDINDKIRELEAFIADECAILASGTSADYDLLIRARKMLQELRYPPISSCAAVCGEKPRVVDETYLEEDDEEMVQIDELSQRMHSR